MLLRSGCYKIIISFILAASVFTADAGVEPAVAVKMLCPAVKKGKNAEEKRQAALYKKLMEIAKGGDVNAVDKNKQTALMHAAAMDNRLAVCWLVAKGADVKRRNAKNKTALECTADPNIQELLEKCADERKRLTEEDEKNVHRWYAGDGKSLREGIFQNRSLSAVAAARKMRVDLSGTHEGKLIAQWNISPEVYAYLVRTGYDVNARGENGETALNIETSGDLAQLMLALDMKLNPENSEQMLWSALHRDDVEGAAAALKKKPELINEAERIIGAAKSGKMVRVLVEAGLEVKAALLRAAIRGGGRAPVVKELLAAGCPLEAGDQSLLQEIATHCPSAGDTAKLLVDAGVSVTDDDLRNAVEARSLPLVQLALEKGASAKQLDKAGRNLLHILYYGSPHRDVGAIAKLLVKAGADVHHTYNLQYVASGGVRFCEKATPLHFALIMGHYTRGLHFHDESRSAARELRVKGASALIGMMKKVPENILEYVCCNELTLQQIGDIALMLLDKGASTKVAGENSLLAGVGAYDDRVTKRLLDAGLGKNKDELTEALQNARTAEVVDVLLAAGADKNVISAHVQWGEPGCILPVVKRLLEAGAATEWVDEEGAKLYALDMLGVPRGHSASLRNEDYTGVAQELIKAGAEIDLFAAKGVYEYTPLLKMVLKTTPDLNVQNDAGNTVIMQWMLQDKLSSDSLKVFLQAGAKTDIRNKEGKTLLMIAQEKYDELCREADKKSFYEDRLKDMEKIIRLLKAMNN